LALKTEGLRVLAQSDSFPVREAGSKSGAGSDWLEDARPRPRLYAAGYILAALRLNHAAPKLEAKSYFIIQW